MKPPLAPLLLGAAVLGFSSGMPNHPEFRPNQLTLHHDATFCGHCKWANMDFDCDFRAKYLMQHWHMTEEQAETSLMEQGECHPIIEQEADDVGNSMAPSVEEVSGGAATPAVESVGTTNATLSALNENAIDPEGSGPSNEEGSGALAGTAGLSDENINAQYTGQEGADEVDVAASPSVEGGSGADATTAVESVGTTNATLSALNENPTNPEGSGPSNEEGSGALAGTAGLSDESINAQYTGQEGADEVDVAASESREESRQEMNPPSMMHGQSMIHGQPHIKEGVSKEGDGGGSDGGKTLFLIVALFLVATVMVVEHRRRKGAERELFYFKQAAEEVFRQQYRDRESVVEEEGQIRESLEDSDNDSESDSDSDNEPRDLVSIL